MSENSMMMGYAMKLPCEPDTERYEELIENFDSEKLNEWQHFYDYDGSECLVYLTASEWNFYDDVTTSVNIKQILEVSQSVHEHLEDYELAVDVDIHFFVKTWYNGTDMGSIFEEEKHE